jgi:hypothetical protein
MRYIVAIFLLCISGIAFAQKSKIVDPPPCSNCWVLNTGQHYSYTKAPSVTVKLGPDRYGVIIAGGYRPGSAEAAACNYVGGSKSELFDPNSNQWIVLPESNPTYDNHLAYLSSVNKVLLIGKLCSGKHLIYSQILNLDHILDGNNRWVPTGKNQISTSGYRQISQIPIASDVQINTLTSVGYDPVSKGIQAGATNAIVLATKYDTENGAFLSYPYKTYAYMIYDPVNDIWNVNHLDPKYELRTCGYPILVKTQGKHSDDYHSQYEIVMLDPYCGDNITQKYTFTDFTKTYFSRNLPFRMQDPLIQGMYGRWNPFRALMILSNPISKVDWGTYDLGQFESGEQNAPPIDAPQTPRLDGKFLSIGMKDGDAVDISITQSLITVGGRDPITYRPLLSCDNFYLALGSCGQLNKERIDSSLNELRGIYKAAIIIGGNTPDSASTSEIYYWPTEPLGIIGY